MRPKVVGTDGQLLKGVSPLWGQEVRYEVLKSSGSTPPDGSNTEEKDSLRAQRTSSVVDFLDAFEDASTKFPKHRHLVGDTKAKAKQRDQNFWPGMLLSDYDWSENGVIALARQIQSEYWSLTSYSLFISITSYLLVNLWLDRSSVLSKGTEVTVEPCDLSQPGTLVPAKGSYYATIHSVVSVVGEGVISARTTLARSWPSRRAATSRWAVLLVTRSSGALQASVHTVTTLALLHPRGLCLPMRDASLCASALTPNLSTGPGPSLGSNT